MGHVTQTRIRDEFPILDQMVNGHRLTYLDNSATMQRPRAVLAAMASFDLEDNANVHRGVHTLSMRATDRFDLARRQIARHVNAKGASEIIFTKGCTEAINLVAGSWGRRNLNPGDTVLVSTMEHHSNIVPWQVVCQERGATVKPIPLTESGDIDLAAYEELLKSGNVRIVCVKHVCNAIGTVNPIKVMAQAAHNHGAAILVDGAQALAHQKVNVQDLGADFYAMSSHKVYGPMGIGALYGRRELLEGMPPYQTGGGMIQTVTIEESSYAPLPDKFEPGTPNVAGAIGFGAALEWINEVGIDEVANDEVELRDRAAKLLADVPGVQVIGSPARGAGIVSFVMEQAHPHDVGTILDSEGVAVRSGHHCCQPLMKHFGVPATTRASFAAYSIPEDVEALLRGVRKVVTIFG